VSLLLAMTALVRVAPAWVGQADGAAFCSSARGVVSPPSALSIRGAHVHRAHRGRILAFPPPLGRRARRCLPLMAREGNGMSDPGIMGLDLQVSTVMGLEALVKQELAALGYPDAVAKNGRVEFKGDGAAVARCNVGLRTATRVLLKVAEFPARTFDELYDGVSAVPWRDIIHKGCAFPVIGKSVKSALHSVPACQSITKKAVAKALAGGASRDGGDVTVMEDDRLGVCQIEVSIKNDIATLSVDTSGDALNRRGYRTRILQRGAPLKETLAAAMLLLSRWTPDRPLYDPFCGSGTILLEAAMIACNQAPGMNRRFAAEGLPLITSGDVWDDAIEEARDKLTPDVARRAQIFGSDIDRNAVDLTYQHLEAANMFKLVNLNCADVHKIKPPPGDFGCIVTNPPYGMRLGDNRGANAGLSSLADLLPTWSVFALSGDDYFERDYGQIATKRRKLYNGNIPCQLYQYFGPLPPKPLRDDDSDQGDERRKDDISTSVLMMTKGDQSRLGDTFEGGGDEASGGDGNGAGGAAMGVSASADGAQEGGKRTLKPVQRSVRGKRARGTGGGVDDGEDQDAYSWNPELSLHRRIKSWVCIKQCGACCYLGLDGEGLEFLSTEEERGQYKEMLGADGWCVHFDKEKRECKQYETRPRFCRTSEEVFEELYDVPREEFAEAAIECCVDSIGGVYGEESQEMHRYLRSIGEDPENPENIPLFDKDILGQHE